MNFIIGFRKIYFLKFDFFREYSRSSGNVIRRILFSFDVKEEIFLKQKMHLQKHWAFEGAYIERAIFVPI
jgi:hypothetical protein